MFIAVTAYTFANKNSNCAITANRLFLLKKTLPITA